MFGIKSQLNMPQDIYNEICLGLISKYDVFKKPVHKEKLSKFYS